jgi:tRNA-specific 2-thiouridylase
MEDAGAVARVQGFPHYVFDYEDRFREEVIDPFVAEYLAGRTPNPCIACNSRLKFGPLMRAAESLGCEKLATGHYARVESDADGRYHLLKAKDRAKDQTYFLYTLNQTHLSRLLFPLGELEKSEVRNISRNLGLVTAEKPESMDICFVPGGDYGEVLKKYAPAVIRPGDMVSTDGKVLGRHEGLAFYTVGQRRGLGVSGGEPLYVIRLDRDRNEVVVGGPESLMSRNASGSSAAFVAGPDREPREAFRCQVKIRSSHPGADAWVRPLGEGRWNIEFDQPQRAITPGQAAVFYDVDECLGGVTLDDSGR